MAKPTQDRLKELFHYDPETGVFTKKGASNAGRRPSYKFGKVGAGRINQLGYVMVMVDGTNYISGGLAWLYENGAWPHARIKYIDGNKLNNRIVNIRVQDGCAEAIKAQKITHDRLKEVLHYEPETGWFTWRISSAVAKPGERAGGGHGLGYRSIGLDYRKYLEHILAWFYMTGTWPTKEVDHINLDKSDNRWENLREATRSQNGHNKNQNPRNKTGTKGVHLHGNKYRARLWVDGKDFDLGSYDTIEEASAARRAAEKLYLGNFAKPDKLQWSTPTITEVVP